MANQLCDRHAVWLWKRFQPGQDGLSRYYRQRQRWDFRSKWGYGVWLKRSMAVDRHVTGVCFLVRSVRRTMSRSRHESPVFLSMRDTQHVWRVEYQLRLHRAMWKHHGQQWKQKKKSQHVEAMPRQDSRKPCPKRAKQHHQEQGHERHLTTSSDAIGVERWRSCRQTC